MDDIRDVNKKIKCQEKTMEDLQRSIRNLTSENEECQREINRLYFAVITLGISSIIAALANLRP